MRNRKTMVLTATMYQTPEEIRFHLACQFIGNAVAAGYKVMVVDNSPNPTIGESFEKIGARVFPQPSTTPGMGEQRRLLFHLAGTSSTTPFFLWSEPEKPDLIRSIPEIIAPLRDDKADIVIPGRTEESLQTYPEFQIESERRMNAIYAEATGKPFDPAFGPVALHGKVLHYFAKCNPTKRYGILDGYIQHVAPLEAMADGHRVASVAVDCFYPIQQRKEEEGKLSLDMRRKRQYQFEVLTGAYRVVANALGLRQQ